MATPVLTEIFEQVKILPDELQYEVLSFVRALRTRIKQGTPGKNLVKFSGIIPQNDIDEIRRAIETGCEHVDLNEW